MIYIDSSVLLTVYLGQPRAEEARALLAGDPVRVSSWLLAVEIPVVLRRVLRPEREAQLLSVALERFDRDVGTISLVEGLPEIARRVRTDPRLAGCRSLDAVHAATALIVRETTGHPLRFATFDHRLAEVVATLPLET